MSLPNKHEFSVRHSIVFDNGVFWLVDNSTDEKIIGTEAKNLMDAIRKFEEMCVLDDLTKEITSVYL